MNSPLEVEYGFEGANPRSADRVTREAPDRFRVEPFNEPGATHNYYFRFNTRVVNRTDEERSVELLVEWPALAEHEYHYEFYYYGDVGEWEWTYAHVEGTTAKLRIVVPPGTTYVGYFPRYGYSHLLEYLETLEESAFAERWVAGESHDGREIPGVTITDPGVDDGGKDVLLVDARGHPYETSSSYIAEEMMTYLRSDDRSAARIREANVVHFLPMVNPDGVVRGTSELTRPNGTDYDKVSVESDEPAVRALLDFADEIRPDCWFDVHSWAYVDLDGLSFATDEWVVDAIRERIPDGSFGDYEWDVSYAEDTPEGWFWNWVVEDDVAAGAALSIAWYGRSEADVRAIGRRLIEAMAAGVAGQ